jgi:hypothetical protein
MIKPPARSLLPLLSVVALAACGSTQSSSPTPPTVTVTAPPPATTGGASTTPAPPAPTTTQPTRTTPPPSTTTPGSTRTAPGPAFTRTTGGTAPGGDLQSAVARLRGLGFTPLSTGTYDGNQTLRVLVGARTGSADARTQQAFFFDGSRYLGTDAAATSGRIAVTGHGDTEVTLRYGIYRPGDPDCCPSGTPRTVRFALDSGRLVPLDPIPAAAARR